MMSCLLGLNLLVASGKYGRLLGWLYIGDESVSLNEQMIEKVMLIHMMEELKI